MGLEVLKMPYFCFSNGLFYYPYIYDSGGISEISPDLEVREDCFEAQDIITIANPPPFEGYDCRCRPYYSETISSIEENQELDHAIIVTEPYVYRSGNIGIDITHYFKLEGNEVTLEGVLA